MSDPNDLEFVALVNAIYCKPVGKRDTFVTDREDKSAEWVSSITLDGECVKIKRDANEIWVPLSQVRQMRPKDKKEIPKQPEAPRVSVIREIPIAVVVPKEMPDEKTPELPETAQRRKAGRPKKVQE